MKPTQEQLIKFWEWCGFREYREEEHLGATFKVLVPYPRLTLDSLFKWAVPKLLPKTLMMETVVEHWDKQGDVYMYEFAILSEKPSGGLWTAYDRDPALAFFWAIWKLIESGKEEKMQSEKEARKDQLLQSLEECEAAVEVARNELAKFYQENPEVAPPKPSWAERIRELRR